ncbi:MAG: NTP transferase domain-containing protein [Ignavibacteria bacterium]|nr:NTP transferase domain-containing protein [Ignavibacteria bacterium]
MKAMILSAGYGTRLLPYTGKLPKALIKYKGKPMIEYQIDRLKRAGISEIIINAHHFSELIQKHFSENEYGIKITVIPEKYILGTGGGIINAGEYLSDEDYFIVINVDVDTDMDLDRMILYNLSTEPFATIAVQKRYSKRYLEFDNDMKLIGREEENSVPYNLFAFNGIHLLSRRIFNEVKNAEMSDIISIYLKALRSGEVIRGYDAGECKFKDLGKKENLFSE